MLARLLCVSLLPFLAPLELERDEGPTVVVVGASLAAGPDYVVLGCAPNDDSEEPEDIYTYPEVLAAWEPAWHLHDFGDGYFFSDAETRGREQIERALAADPDLVLAVDFLFWFGYGPRPDWSRAGFLRREGFGLLERLWADAPDEARPTVLVGLLPDVRHSPFIPRPARPSDEALGALNEAIRTWADGHPNVHLVPLEQRMSRMQAGEDVRLGKTTYEALDLDRLLLDDELHPSTHGSVLVAALCLETLREVGHVPPPVTAVAELDLWDVGERLIAARKQPVERPAAAGER